MFPSHDLISFGNNKQQFRCLLSASFTLTHTTSDTSIRVAAIGEGMDSGDKGFPKAQTNALKYALRQSFLIETGDDPDKYASTEDGGVVQPFRTTRERTALWKKIKEEIEMAESIDAINDIVNGTRKADLIKIKESDMGDELYIQLIDCASATKKAFIDAGMGDEGNS